MASITIILTKILTQINIGKETKLIKNVLFLFIKTIGGI
jgi:hypothetical protein